MKKIIILILSSFLLSACNISNSIKQPEEYYLTIKDVDIKPHMFFNTIKSLFGGFNDYRYDEEDNIIFEYDGFEIETYFDNEVEKVKTIRITDDETTTNEGVKIGDSKSKMIKVYGKDYQNDNNKFIYKVNDTSLSFILENDIIIGIEYN